MKRTIRFVVALIAGGLSGFLIYMVLAVLIFRDRVAPDWFIPVVFLGGWVISTWFLIHGGRTVSNVIARGFLLGAGEWFIMIPAGLLMGGMAFADVTDEATTDAEMLGATLGAGSFAFLAGGVSIAMVFFCLLGYFITFLTTREMKHDRK